MTTALMQQELQAYGAQIAQERAERAQMPGGQVREFCDWLRQWYAEQQEEVEQIKFGNPWQMRRRVQP